MASTKKTSPKGTNDKRHLASVYGVAGTIVFHAMVLLLLWLSVLRSKAPEQPNGIEVHFEEVEEVDATGAVASGGLSAENDDTTPTEPLPEEPAAAPERLVTQDIEESIAVPDTRKQEEENRRKAAERAAREEAERLRKEREEAIARRVSGAFGSATASGSGTASGNTTGTVESGVASGGYGSFDLNGRTLGAAGLPRPAYVIQEEGRIVVNITVDPKGKVIFAEIGRGTTIDNNAMRRSALEAARRATFNAIDGVNNQTGAITYVYNLK